ncbi:MAG TPA: oligopeptide/dipeptide ABC transporter ATP-binding protein [Nevskiaceae bacterium]|nr:oligopeptide/dipeptide ABC transporter ATP-binding protein [Nevskiaceae bacterium]
MRMTASGQFARLKTGDALLLAVRRLALRYPGRDGVPVHALRDVHLNLHEGETLGIVGESGCGKSTLARVLVGLQSANAGAINFDGRDISRLSEAQWRPLRRQIQMVFQDPASSLDPRMTVERIVAEPLEALYPESPAKERTARTRAAVQRVGLGDALLKRHPHELSGGQAQRVAIARALIVQPRILICDEPISALDVSVQAQIINLLRDLQDESGLSMIFISHDLAAVRYLSHRVMVMYLGRVMETASSDTLFSKPQHPYTQALLAAIPGRSTREQRVIGGEVPDPRFPPSGCVFRTRCPVADARCAMAVPPSRRTISGGFAACFYATPAPRVVHAPDEAPARDDEDEGASG